MSGVSKVNSPVRGTSFYLSCSSAGTFEQPRFLFLRLIERADLIFQTIHQSAVGDAPTKTT